MNTRFKYGLNSLLVSALAIQFLASAAPASASQTGSIRFDGDPHGFSFVAESATKHGTVVDTFVSSDATFKILGQPGTTVKVEPNLVLSNGHNGFAFTFTEYPSTPKPVSSLVDDLIDLGIPPTQAQAEAGASTTSGSGLLAASGASHLSQWSHVCYDYYQYSGDGHFSSHGCGDSWIDWKDPSNQLHWGLTSQYKITGQDNWEHMRGIYWRMEWPSGNEVTDWEPFTGVTTSGSCGSRTYSVDLTVKSPDIDFGTTESYTQDLCPTYYGPWMPSGVNTKLSTGARWTGDVPSKYAMGVAGAQSINSPASAPASPVKNVYLLEW